MILIKSFPGRLGIGRLWMWWWDIAKVISALVYVLFLIVVLSIVWLMVLVSIVVQTICSEWTSAPVVRFTATSRAMSLFIDIALQMRIAVSWAIAIIILVIIWLLSYLSGLLLYWRSQWITLSLSIKQTFFLDNSPTFSLFLLPRWLLSFIVLWLLKSPLISLFLKFVRVSHGNLRACKCTIAFPLIQEFPPFWWHFWYCDLT